METNKKKILERYGFLKREIMLSYNDSAKAEKLKLELAKVLMNMELNDLTQKDYNKFNAKRKKQAQNKALIENNKTREKSLTKGILSISLGLLAIFAGIGLTELTRGGFIFYGLIIVGIATIIKGGVDIYIYKEMK